MVIRFATCVDINLKKNYSLENENVCIYSLGWKREKIKNYITKIFVEISPAIN